MKKSTTIITTEVLRDVHFKTSTFGTQQLLLYSITHGELNFCISSTQSSDTSI